MINTDLSPEPLSLPDGQLKDFQVFESPTHKTTRLLFDYWKSIRNGNQMPFRKDMDPVHIPSLLPHLGVLDVDRSEGLRFKVRLYGTMAVDIAGEERTGKFLEDFSPDIPDTARRAMLQRWQTTFTQTCDTCSPRFSRGRRSDPERSFNIAHTAILPLTSDGSTVSQLLAMIVTQSDTDAL